MANVGLESSNENGLSGAFVENLLQRFEFNRIAHRRAVGCRFHVTDFGCLCSRAFERALNHFAFFADARNRVAVRLATMTNRRAANHAMDGITIGQRL